MDEINITDNKNFKLNGYESGKLGELQQKSYDEGLPIIPVETACLLRTLTALKKPEKVLEIGCAVGFSASLMASHMPENGQVTTIDRYPQMIELARQNFKNLGMDDKVRLIEGDAAEILPLLGGKFDLIFLDAAKAQYLQFLPDCLRLLNTGGLFICDDVLHDGIITKNRYTVPRRQRTTHRRMRAFLWLITNAEGLETSVLPIGAGVSISVKTADEVVLKGYDINEF